jgi:hypothetical protein
MEQKGHNMAKTDNKTAEQLAADQAETIAKLTAGMELLTSELAAVKETAGKSEDRNTHIGDPTAKYHGYAIVNAADKTRYQKWTHVHSDSIEEILAECAKVGAAAFAEGVMANRPIGSFKYFLAKPTMAAWKAAKPTA